VILKTRVALGVARDHFRVAHATLCHLSRSAPAELLDTEQPSSFRDDMASLSLREESTTIASYSLCDGLQVFVCQGDITKQHADALVNAANQDLDHSAGVAAALSRAGGPEIQRESDELVKCFGKIPIGETVVTTGGNLKCKKLLHAVGPVGGKASDRDKMLLEKTVHCALNLSEIMEFQSIAIPCISSGVSGVPLTVLPVDWQTGVVVPIFKKGDRRVCSNYRGSHSSASPGKSMPGCWRGGFVR
uniref:Macro domain-containing protein n=1 Tax=Maylandia zebra TaxID=106582 RepID=A0A3P9CZR3_9CICH